MFTMEEVIKLAHERDIDIKQIIEISSSGRYTGKSGKNGHLHSIVMHYDQDFLEWHKNDKHKFEHVPWDMIGSIISSTVPKEFAIGRNKEIKDAVEEVLNNRKSGTISAEEAMSALQKWFDKVKANDEG